VSAACGGYGEFSDEQELPQRLKQLSPRTVIIDIEPLVAYWDSTQDTLDRGITHVLDLVAAIPSVAVVCFATNSARRPSAQPRSTEVHVVYLASAHKPVQIKPYLSFPDRPGCRRRVLHEQFRGRAGTGRALLLNPTVDQAATGRGNAAQVKGLGSGRAGL
jgi:hypothetical protein